MYKINKKEWLEKLAIVHKQTQEIVQQEKEGVSVLTATVTCSCGLKRGALKAYQCLYCSVRLCTVCAETHFGQTIKEYRAENPVEGFTV